MKPSGIVSFYNVPADAGDPDVKVYVNNELFETGGGSSDFTTCMVTPGSRGIDVSLPVVDEENNTISMGFPSEAVKVVLYKGSIKIPVAYLDVTIDSGDAVYDSGNDIVTITGDCTLSIYTR